MKREIKFRGKDPKGGWVKGYYLQDLTQGKMLSYIFNCPFYWEVIPETVGQFTGLLDKNGKEIYEGDIVTKHYTDRDVIYVCIYIEKYACFAFDRNIKFGEYYYFQKIDSPKLQIIGNIHDNPELLKTETL